jgi:hypothetical protein
MWAPGLGERVHVEGREGAFFVCSVDWEQRLVSLVSATSIHADNDVPFSAIIPPATEPKEAKARA